MLDLTDNEIRDITKYLEAGKPLPDKYRFLLFEDKRQIELVWNGKTNEVCNVVLPFQIIEQVDEPRAEVDTKLQGTLEFGLDARGRQLRGWTNKLIWGDNKLILPSLKNGPMRQEIEDNGGIKLIYIDPPFDVGADFSMDIPIGDEQFTKEPSVLEELAYRDTWGKGTDSFVAMLHERLVLLRELLAPDGAIFVHCDWRVCSQIRIILDEVFGNPQFRNEIIWQKIRTTKAQSIGYGNVHDTIFYYSKGQQAPFFGQYKALDEAYIKSHYREDPKTGRLYRTVSMLQKGQGPARRFGDKVLEPPPGRHWIWSQERIDTALAANLIRFTSNGRPEKVQFLDSIEGDIVDDMWDDVYPINSQALEALGYPTQGVPGEADYKGRCSCL